MEIFILSFLIVSLAALGLALGVIAGRPPIRAGCGGAADPDSGCGICGSPIAGGCNTNADRIGP